MRLDQLRKRLKRHKLDGMLVSQPANVRYLTGYTGEGVLLVTAERAVLAADFRYWEQAERQAPELELYKILTRLDPIYPGLLPAAGKPGRVGFESAYVTVSEYHKMMAAKASVEWVAVEDMVEPLRMIKSREELALIRQAARISDQALADLRTWLKPGMTERQVGWELEAFMRTHGAEAIAFDISVAAGPGGAEPHHVPDNREIQTGEPIVVDLGAVVAGYRSDITRTFCLGRPPKRFSRIYELVLTAQETALAGIRAGITGQQADTLARDVIVAAGHAKHFGHSLGHGVGLAVHELPAARQTNQEPLPANATLTVEPGIYLPGWGGVRIEDLVIIRKNGVELISHASKEPLI